jgi:hypothetical protein
MVVNVTMVRWTGATNTNIPNLLNKPISKGVCLKTVCDTSTCVMVSMALVETGTERAIKRYAEEGLTAAVCLRLTKLSHNKAPRILIADA